MWYVSGQNLSMVEGDYGIALPVTINGTELAETDSIRITFKTEKNGEVVLTKDFTSITDNTFNLEFTQEESAKLGIGVYAYTLDWYQDGVFQCNIIPFATLKVVDKA